MEKFKAHLDIILPDTEVFDLIGAKLSVGAAALFYDGKPRGGAWVRACFFAKALNKKLVIV